MTRMLTLAAPFGALVLAAACNPSVVSPIITGGASAEPPIVTSGAGSGGGSSGSGSSGGAGSGSGSSGSAGSGSGSSGSAGSGSGSSGSSSSGGGSADGGVNVPTACVSYPPDDGGVSGATGWKWNVECPLSIETFCADGGANGAPCVATYSPFDPSPFCAYTNVSSVEFFGSCNGYNVVSVFGFEPCPADPELYAMYSYDETSGALVRVDSDGVPSYTKCIAGASGAMFDVFGCNQPLMFNCPGH